MTDALKVMREPFPADAISKLPKGREDKSKRARCNTCKGYHDPSMFHLDYVGHAAITDRLLNADPEWTWEPFATDDRGLPALDYDKAGNPVGLWIRLTVGDVTRIGYGSVESAKSEAIKELIGDALRNASMRFGAALDLWHKGDLPDQPDELTPEPSPQEVAYRATNALKAELFRMVGNDIEEAAGLFAALAAEHGLAGEVDTITDESVRTQILAAAKEITEANT